MPTMLPSFRWELESAHASPAHFGTARRFQDGKSEEGKSAVCQEPASFAFSPAERQRVPNICSAPPEGGVRFQL